MKRMILVLSTAIAVSVLGGAGVRAETAIERQCATGKCTCTYLAGTCRTWIKQNGGELAICDTYRQSCMNSGSWVSGNRNIATVIRR